MVLNNSLNLSEPHFPIWINQGSSGTGFQGSLKGVPVKPRVIDVTSLSLSFLTCKMKLGMQFASQVCLEDSIASSLMQTTCKVSSLVFSSLKMGKNSSHSKVVMKIHCLLQAAVGADWVRSRHLSCGNTWHNCKMISFWGKKKRYVIIYV